jgi:hypothetical protein
MDAVEHDLSPEQWAALQAAWGGCVLRRHRHPAAARLRRLDERAFLDRHVAIRVDLAERFGAADGCIEA